MDEYFVKYISAIAALYFKTVSFFVKIISIHDGDLFSGTYAGYTAYPLSKSYNVPVGSLPLLLKQCFAIFAVAERWLLLDIG